MIHIDHATGKQAVLVPPHLLPHAAGAIALGTDGRLTVSDTWSQEPLLRVDPATGRATAASPPLPGVVIFLASAPDNSVFAEVQDPPTGAILRIPPGSGTPSTVATGLFTGLALSPDGKSLVARDAFHRVGDLVRIDVATGAMEPVPSDGKLGFPNGLAFDASGRIVAAENPGRVLRIDPVSGATTVITDSGFLEIPNGIAVVPGAATVPLPRALWPMAAMLVAVGFLIGATNRRPNRG